MDFDDLDREEVDRRCEDADGLEGVGEAFMRAQACPFICRAIRRCMVSAMAHEDSSDNSYLDDITIGSFVRVLQVKHVVQEHKVRGRLENPAGWITLLTTWNEETTTELLEETSSGVYEISNVARVTSTLSLLPSEGCKDIGDLYEGTIVRVLEIELAHDERRIRGRIEHPYAGWISILNTENDYRWAERREKGTEVPLLSLADIEVGSTMHLLSDPDALSEACQELGSLTPEQCLLATGAELTVLEVDARYERLRCRVPLFGEEWFAMSCFVHTSSEVQEDLPDFSAADARKEEEEPPRRTRAFSSLARKFAPTEEDEVPTTAIVQASSSSSSRPPAPPRPPYVEPQPTEAEAEALAALVRNARAAPEPEVDAIVVRDPSVPAPAPRQEQPAKDVYALEDFPVGCLVETSDSMALRAGEKSSSKELLHLDKGHQCSVLEHSTEAGSRRMRVRETRSQLEGWISCATKAGRPLVLLAVAGVGGAVPMPSIDEVLAKIDEDDDDRGVEQDLPGRNRVDIEAEPDDLVLQREKAEEAVAVWRGFTDLARLDTADEIRGIEEAALGLEVRRHELLRWGGWDNPAEQQVTMAEDRRLRFMETEVLKREARERKLKDRLQRAMAKQMAGSRPMPKSRAIVRRNASSIPGPHGGASSSSRHSEQHLAIDDMRQRLEEERLESAELQARETAEEAGMTLEEVLRATREEAVAMEAEWEAAQAQEDANYDEPYIEPGTIIRVCGLRGVAELNDMVGMVERWDPKTDRWVVRLQNGQCKKLREENLLPCEDEADEQDGVAADEGPGGPDDFGGAPFAVSMRQGQAVGPPKGDVSQPQRPWYAPWMVAHE